MEIRNNTPSFGMAFRVPTYVIKKGELIENRTAALSHCENLLFGQENSKLMTRALKQFKKEQDKNRYFDIEYVGFEDFPNKYQLRIMNGDEVKKVFNQDSKFLSITDQKVKKLKEKISNADSKLKKRIYGMQGVCLLVKEFLKTLIIKPKNILPEPFKAAAQEANELNQAFINQQKNKDTIYNTFKNYKPNT